MWQHDCIKLKRNESLRLNIYLRWMFFDNLQDLCRQRMQSKSSEKPEPINVAARVGSVSTSEAAVRSPSSRSSTSSWYVTLF